ncbi:NADPH:quinone reductase-like Zn-dependent oxidoreductase [Micromonospora sp. Llam0]|uniref:quinone oxidoreductase family protein n=1 Tax=Micromonospora sp. Llam0 TaxID=2485143 RepID=UPI000F9C6629|nr:zinc-binding alcohol dehydrogenase family protein [Micromonospora sp. Llam0]ROO61829.1 NADPH:quinone reductase-like Zn-dependent oxidoreductase [Micromonospora sp. Llam0]
MAASESMTAAVLTGYGEPPTVQRRPRPTPATGQVLVRVSAAPITPLDLLCASGGSYLGPPALPYVPGVQGVGTLADGSGVWFPTHAGLAPGDGGLAGYAAVAVADLVPLPDGVDHRLIAALGYSAVAAWSALTLRGGLRPGEDVLILGASGTVGQAGVQIARLVGARRITAAARSAAAAERLRALGADAVVPLRADDDVPGLADRLREAAGGPVDLVLDPLFGVPAAAALRVLRPGGRLVNLGSSAGATAPIDSATLRGGSLRVLGYTNNELTGQQRAAALVAIAGHAHAGRLTVDHQVRPLDEVAAAWQAQADGTAGARIVVTLV